MVLFDQTANVNARQAACNKDKGNKEVCRGQLRALQNQTVTKRCAKIAVQTAEKMHMYKKLLLALLNCRTAF